MLAKLLFCDGGDFERSLRRRQGAALALLVIRFLIVAIEVQRIARRLGESGMMGRYFVYDLLSPLWALALSVMLMRKDDRVWR